MPNKTMIFGLNSHNVGKQSGTHLIGPKWTILKTRIYLDLIRKLFPIVYGFHLGKKKSKIYHGYEPLKEESTTFFP